MSQTKENKKTTNTDDKSVNNAEETVVETAKTDKKKETASNENKLEQLKIERDAALEKAEKNWDQFVRLQAEIKNIRRRNEKQVADAHKFSIQRFVEDLLPVVDSLEMGLQAQGDLGKIREGIELTLKQFHNVMEKFEIEVVNPEGEKFNPELHQAMSMQPSSDHEDNEIMIVAQKGYTLNERLVRPAMVMVCKN